MNDQFQHVMVLASIILGLGITHLLLGVNAAIDRISNDDRPIRLSWASGFWLAYLFVWMVLFWWWEFRLLDLLEYWSLWRYFVVIGYALVLFLLVALLVPKDWGSIENMDQYFLSKRRWFYPILLVAFMLDLLDSYMKGGMDYVWGTGALTWGLNIVAVPVCIIGFRSSRIRVHSVIGFVFFVWQLLIGLDVSPLLRGSA
jgi:hypothetical protein